MADEKIDRHDNAELPIDDSGEISGDAFALSPEGREFSEKRIALILYRFGPVGTLDVAKAAGYRFATTLSLLKELRAGGMTLLTRMPGKKYPGHSLTTEGTTHVQDLIEQGEIDLPEDVTLEDVQDIAAWRLKRWDAEQRQPTVAGARRIGWVTAPMTRKAALDRGFINTRILVDWDKIVPGDLSDMARPLEIRRNLKSGEATLVVLVSSATALTIQHYEPQILEQLNTYFGFDAVTKLQLKQGILPLPKGRKRTTGAIRPPDAAPNLESVQDDELKAALDRLHAARYAKR
ncbi:DUF721 domain-containing protein [Lacibacterium aquatile]|uniref:DUF721 domain-containing protein n=1 Tax=Lacibacterium aquatile TaxID=1168082 RepID=A0ABW5DQ78_9PROT